MITTAHVGAAHIIHDLVRSHILRKKGGNGVISYRDNVQTNAAHDRDLKPIDEVSALHEMTNAAGAKIELKEGSEPAD